MLLTLFLALSNPLTTELTLPLAGLALVRVVLLLVSALHLIVAPFAHYWSVAALLDVLLYTPLVFADRCRVCAAVLLVRTCDDQFVYE